LSASKRTFLRSDPVPVVLAFINETSSPRWVRGSPTIGFESSPRVVYPLYFEIIYGGAPVLPRGVQPGALFDGESEYMVLPAGKTHLVEIDLSSLFHFDRVGTYTLTARYYDPAAIKPPGDVIKLGGPLRAPTISIEFEK
jgi:hypothetical protein